MKSELRASALSPILTLQEWFYLCQVHLPASWSCPENSFFFYHTWQKLGRAQELDRQRPPKLHQREATPTSSGPTPGSFRCYGLQLLRASAFAGLEIEPRTSCMPGMSSTTEPHPEPAVKHSVFFHPPCHLADLQSPVFHKASRQLCTKTWDEGMCEGGTLESSFLRQPSLELRQRARSSTVAEFQTDSSSPSGSTPSQPLPCRGVSPQ